ncbi:MAG: wax ester/triacylglycerol synthase family O-acyltransferase [Ilumatobacteraceae bacterium]
MRQLSFLDESFVLMESARTPSHIAPFMIYDPSTAPGGAVSFEDVLDGIRARLPLAACFRQRLVRVPFGLDNSYWIEDAAFDLEYHVREVAVPPPGDWRQFCIQAARIFSRPLDLTRPPWELTVIRGLDDVEGLPPGSFAIVLKVHHSAIDGLTGVQIVTAMHDETPQPQPAPQVEDTWRPEPAPSGWQLAAQAGAHALSSPYHTTRMMARSVQQLRGTRVPRVARPPRTRFNDRVTPHRSFDCARIDLVQIKAIRAGVPGATINDVALAIVGGALQRYLADRDELPDTPMIAAVPISTRMANDAGAGNHVSMMMATLATDVADAGARLEAIHAATAESKEARDGVAAAALLEVADVLPGALLGLAVRGAARVPRLPVVANTLVTNTPGPRHPLYFLGAELVLSTGMCPLVDGMGLAHGISSYVDELNVNVTACREMLPDPASYIECIHKSVDELTDATT